MASRDVLEHIVLTVDRRPHHAIYGFLPLLQQINGLRNRARFCMKGSQPPVAAGLQGFVHYFADCSRAGYR